MKAIIIAEHSEFELSPLTKRIPHALLPVAGKSILMHALEILHRGSIRRVDVIAPTLHDRLRRATDTGPLLGMEVSFMSDSSQLSRASEHCLIVGLTHILDEDWEQVLARLGDLMVHALIPIRMTVSATPVALLQPPKSSIEISNNWSDIHRTEAIHLPIGPGRVMSVSSISEFHRANFNLLRGDYRHLKPAGREYVAGHRASPRARFDARSLKTEVGYFGSRCRVDKTAGLSGQVVIGNRAVVSKGARISDSVVLDQSYVGANTDCSRAIIDRNLLIKVDTGVCLELEDPVLLGTAS